MTDSPTLQVHLDNLQSLVDAGRLTWSLGSQPQSADAPSAQVSFQAMGCAIRAQVESADPTASARLERVPLWFEDWESRLSRFRAESELSRLNGRAGEWVGVSPILWQVIRDAIQAAAFSGGLVTPTVLPALEAAGYDRPFAEMDRDTEQGVVSPAEVADWRKIHLDPKGRRVRLPPQARLDLGGIGKGWAADRAAAKLRRYGPAMVEAGGDLAISGPRSRGAPWRVAVADPHDPDRDLVQLAVSSGGVATSGKDYRRWRRGGVWQHHLIDPRTGRPSSSDVLSATVVGPSLRMSETAAKTIVLLGSAAGLAWVHGRTNLAALLVLEDGTRVHSLRWQHYLWRS